MLVPSCITVGTVIACTARPCLLCHCTQQRKTPGPRCLERLEASAHLTGSLAALGCTLLLPHYTPLPLPLASNEESCKGRAERAPVWCALLSRTRVEHLPQRSSASQPAAIPRRPLVSAAQSPGSARVAVLRLPSARGQSPPAPKRGPAPRQCPFRPPGLAQSAQLRHGEEGAAHCGFSTPGARPQGREAAAGSTGGSGLWE